MLDNCINRKEKDLKKSILDAESKAEILSDLILELEDDLPLFEEMKLIVEELCSELSMIMDEL